MSANKIYAEGTISVTNGSANFIGHGTAWDLALLAGGIVYVEGAGGASAPIEAVTSDTTGYFSLAWDGPTLAGVRYTIYLEHASAADAIEANANLLDASRRLRIGSIRGFDANGSLAGRSTYDAAQPPFVYAVTTSTPWLFYAKNSAATGDWSPGSTVEGAPGEPGEPGVDGMGDAYDLHFGALGRPGASEEFETLIARTVTFPLGFTGSVARVSAAATDEAVFAIRRIQPNGNDTTIGSITFEEGETVGAFSGAGAALSAGDRIRIVSPSPKDETLSGLLFTLAGNR